MLGFTFRVTMEGFVCMHALVLSHAECLLISRNSFAMYLEHVYPPYPQLFHNSHLHLVFKPFRTICAIQIFPVCAFCEGWLNTQPGVTTTFRINWVSLSQQLTNPDSSQPGVGFHSQPPLVYMLGFGLALTCTGFYVSLAFNFQIRLFSLEYPWRSGLFRGSGQ